MRFQVLQSIMMVALTVVPFAGCDVEEPEDVALRGHDGDACTYVCEVCGESDVTNNCLQMCSVLGCEVKCPVVLTCEPGFLWDELTCSCVPEDGVIPCGPNKCDVGEVCCNESCGICTLPGEPCTAQYCLPDECGEIEGVPVRCPHQAMECCDPDTNTCAPEGQCL